MFSAHSITFYLQKLFVFSFLLQIKLIVKHEIHRIALIPAVFYLPAMNGMNHTIIIIMNHNVARTITLIQSRKTNPPEQFHYDYYCHI